MSEEAFDTLVDCQGLNCPLPVLKTKKAIDAISSGKVLKLLATDPGSANDVESWTRRTGNSLLKQSKEGGVYSFLIQKK